MKNVRRYFAVQRDKGLNVAQALAALPREVVKASQLRRTGARRGSVIYGFGLFDRPLVAAYSRSGTNWVRYLVESVSGLPTPGQTRLVGGTDYAFDRAHCAYPTLANYQRVVLLLRDYRECLLRNHERRLAGYTSPLELLSDRSIGQPASWYIDNLAAFDRFAGEKLLIHYEVMMARPAETVRTLGTFLGLEAEGVAAFVAALPAHQRRSVAAYRAGGHAATELAAFDPRQHAQRLLTDEQARAFDAYYWQTYPQLAERYLQRYRWEAG